MALVMPNMYHLHNSPATWPTKHSLHAITMVRRCVTVRQAHPVCDIINAALVGHPNSGFFCGMLSNFLLRKDRSAALFSALRAAMWMCTASKWYMIARLQW